MATFASPYMTLRQYYEFLRTSEIRYEYWDGELRTMAGASRNHNFLTIAIGAELLMALRGSKCEVVVSDQLVRNENASRCVFPDVVVNCESARIVNEGIDTLLDPLVIVEVLSPSTARLDRSKKFDYYSSFVSLKELLFVHQDEMLIEHHWRNDINDEWKLRHYSQGEDMIRFTSIAANVTIAAIYERVVFE